MVSYSTIAYLASHDRISPSRNPCPGRRPFLAAVKDTIIEGPKLELRRDTQFSFSQRHIKPPAHSSSEAHSAISKDIFLSEHSSGRYIFSWETHGNLYGFPACIEDDITTGKTVVLNVSRTIVSESRRKFDHTAIFNVLVATPVLRHLLRNNGRETSDDIALSIERASTYKVTGTDVKIIENNASIETGVK
jgi:ribose 1,5-bisphosphokinase